MVKLMIWQGAYLMSNRWHSHNDLSLGFFMGSYAVAVMVYGHTISSQKLRNVVDQTEIDNMQVLTASISRWVRNGVTYMHTISGKKICIKHIVQVRITQQTFSQENTPVKTVGNKKNDDRVRKKRYETNSEAKFHKVISVYATHFVSGVGNSKEGRHSILFYGSHLHKSRLAI